MASAAARGRRSDGLHDNAAPAGPAGAAEDLYAVLGLSRECTDAELKLAYRRLALVWHPDRCSASGGSVEEAKERFQEIQGAYAVLSDSNKRFLYDVGVYDSDGNDDLSGMGGFLGEMADMMRQTTPTESFEDLQRLFVDMFQDDLDPGFFGGPLPAQDQNQAQGPPCTSSSSSSPPAGSRSRAHTPPSMPRPGVNKRGSSAMPSSASGTGKRPRPSGAGFGLDMGLSGFCFMVSAPEQAPWPCDGGERRSDRRPRMSTSRGAAGYGASRRSSGTPWQ